VSQLRGDCDDSKAAQCGETFHNVSHKLPLNYPQGSALRADKARELKVALYKHHSFFMRPVKISQEAT